MRLLEGLAELIAPTRCAGCDLPGAVFCVSCDSAMQRVGEGACPRCGAPFGYLTCTECWDREWSFDAAVCVAGFEAPLTRALIIHKDGGEQRLAVTFGAWIAGAVGDAWPGWAEAVTYVPATDAAYRRRGFDHGRAIAESAAATLGLPIERLLERNASRDQRALGRSARALNAEGSFRARPSSGRIVLVDDVFTTGATFDAAASALLDAGAAQVRVAAVARAW